MQTYYQETEKYWEDVFAKQKVYNPHQKLAYRKIEEALMWLSEGSRNIIDFACGDGRLLSRCFNYGVKKICGIDISEEAISLARRVMKDYNLEKHSSFICGDVNSLRNFSNKSYDGAILSNIIDNVIPADANKILAEIYRILKPSGKIIVKLNPYYRSDKLEEDDEYTKMSKNLYQEDSGLYLYNINDGEFKKLVNSYFKIVKREEINFEEYNMINRLYYLQK